MKACFFRFYWPAFQSTIFCQEILEFFSYERQAIPSIWAIIVILENVVISWTVTSDTWNDVEIFKFIQVKFIQEIELIRLSVSWDYCLTVSYSEFTIAEPLILRRAFFLFSCQRPFALLVTRVHICQIGEKFRVLVSRCWLFQDSTTCSSESATSPSSRYHLCWCRLGIWSPNELGVSPYACYNETRRKR